MEYKVIFGKIRKNGKVYKKGDSIELDPKNETTKYLLKIKNICKRGEAEENQNSEDTRESIELYDSYIEKIDELSKEEMAKLSMLDLDEKKELMSKSIEEIKKELAELNSDDDSENLDDLTDEEKEIYLKLSKVKKEKFWNLDLGTRAEFFNCASQKERDEILKKGQ